MNKYDINSVIAAANSLGDAPFSIIPAKLAASIFKVPSPFALKAIEYARLSLDEKRVLKDIKDVVKSEVSNNEKPPAKGKGKKTKKYEGEID